MSCIYCGKELPHDYIWWGLDGDGVCNKKCEDGMKRQMDAVCRMTDKQFENWMLS